MDRICNNYLLSRLLYSFLGEKVYDTDLIFQDISYINIDILKLMILNKKWNDIINNFYINIIKDNKKQINIFFNCIRIRDNKIILKYFIDSYLENRMLSIKMININEFYLERFNNRYLQECFNTNCLNFNNILSKYCNKCLNSELTKYSNKKCIKYHICKVCEIKEVIKDEYNYEGFCSFKCYIRALKNRKLKQPLNFMKEPIIKIDSINKFFNKKKL